ncbi:MAG: DivIVA domain-containing protein [Oscillospiraceae bacterium]|nr:DivIVA domain-containing protein [Oscillospiraceae bacterium]MBQ2997951.1 DivIVA domain-containing protein [Oscillospiraceae bacterium]MBQ3561427.1 DivIVA domain-containing protein [Oscillospiraceae bacterium]
MITPNDIANKKFEKAAFGYKPEEVDAFLNDIIVSYKEMYQSKVAAEEKLEVLAEKLEEYRANEDSLKTVLLGAQKLGENIVRDSKAKAEVIVADAENQVKQVFAESESKIIKEKETLATLQKETAEFKKHLLAMYRQHLELISLMPENNEENAAEEAVEEQPEAEEAVIEETIEEAEDIDFDEVSMAETKRIDLDVQD